MSIQQVQQNVKPTLAAVPPVSTEWHRGTFSQVNALPLSFSIKTRDAVSLYRARMDNRDVILRVLTGNLRGAAAHCSPAEELFRARKLKMFFYCLSQIQQTTVTSSTFWALRPSCQDWGHTPSYLRCLEWFQRSRPL